MSNLSNLIAAIDLLLADGEIYNAIVHGPASGEGSTVETDGGTVKTLAKVVNDFDVSSAAAVADFEAAISTTISAFLTALGIPTYADLTAANAALTIGQPYYDTALSKLQITTA